MGTALLAFCVSNAPKAFFNLDVIQYILCPFLNFYLTNNCSVVGNECRFLRMDGISCVKQTKYLYLIERYGLFSNQIQISGFA